MKFKFGKWSKRFLIFLLAISIYFLLWFIYQFITNTSDSCVTGLGDIAPTSPGRFQCALIGAEMDVIWPLFVPFWFIYAILFFAIYKLIMYIRKRRRKNTVYSTRQRYPAE